MTAAESVAVLSAAGQAALELAEEYGLPVFPCRPDKAPYTRRGLHDASRSIEQIAAWWVEWPDALVGVPTGAASGLVVVDVDPDGAAWYAEHALDLAARRVHRTRRGHHLVYRAPSGIAIRNSASRIADGVDVRGDGGYVIWWPAHGHEAVGELGDVAEPPPWLLGRMMERETAAAASTPPTPRNGATIADGQRNSTLTSIAGSMRRRGLDAEAIYAAIAAHNAAHCVPPLPDRELRQIAASVTRYAPQDERAEPASDPLEHIRAAIIADLEAGPEAVDNAPPPVFLSPPRFPAAGGVFASPGGGGKTTLVLGEKARIAADMDLYGDHLDLAGSCVFVTAEDGADRGRYLLRELLDDALELGRLTQRQAAAAKAGVRIIGWSRRKYGPIMSVDEYGDAVVRPVWDLLLELIAPYRPVYVTLDPSVLFGPGERHGNDAGAAFAALLHETAQQMSACVQVIEHVAQSVARSGIVDQYVIRGGTGKVDESRLARQLVHVEPDDDEPRPLAITPEDIAKRNVLRLIWHKVSWAPLPPPVWLRRRGYWFDDMPAPSAEEAADLAARAATRSLEDDAAAVERYVLAACGKGARMSQRELARESIIYAADRRLTQRAVSEALRHLLAEGRLTQRELPEHERRGQRQTYVAPANDAIDAIDAKGACGNG